MYYMSHAPRSVCYAPLCVDALLSSITSTKTILLHTTNTMLLQHCTGLFSTTSILLTCTTAALLKEHHFKILFLFLDFDHLFDDHPFLHQSTQIFPQHVANESIATTLV